MKSRPKKSKAEQKREKQERQFLFMKERMKEWFPDPCTSSFFVPPLHFNRTKAERVELASGEIVWETASPSDEWAVDDVALTTVRDVLRLVAARHGPMVVQTELGFGDYLGEPAYAAAAGALCRPSDLKTAGVSKGDFDGNVFHCVYGVLSIEVKAVGLDARGRVLASVAPRTVLARVWKGVGQMAKNRRVLNHVIRDLPDPQPRTSDPEPPSSTSPSSSPSTSTYPSPSPSQTPRPPRVRTTLATPGLTRDQLRAVITNKNGELPINEMRSMMKVPKTKDPVEVLYAKMREAMDLGPSDDPLDFILTRDDFAVNARGLRCPDRWWRLRMEREGPDPALTPDRFRDLVARFVGPATKVAVHTTEPRLSCRSDVRTARDGVAETARRFAPSEVPGTPGRWTPSATQ